jgi:hypothetical protein
LNDIDIYMHYLLSLRKKEREIRSTKIVIYVRSYKPLGIGSYSRTTGSAAQLSLL